MTKRQIDQPELCRGRNRMIQWKHRWSIALLTAAMLLCSADAQDLENLVAESEEEEALWYMERFGYHITYNSERHFPRCIWNA